MATAHRTSGIALKPLVHVPHVSAVPTALTPRVQPLDELVTNRTGVGEGAAMLAFIAMLKQRLLTPRAAYGERERRKSRGISSETLQKKQYNK